MGWGRDVLNDGIKKRVDVVRRSLPVLSHPIVLCRTVDDREVQLLLSGIKCKHQVEYHFIDFFRATVWFVHLVHHHDRFQTYLKGFLKHETSLWHWAFKCIDKQQTAVGHIQYTLHLSTEIGVPRSVNDINFYTFIINGDVLGEDGYTTLTLQIVVIQH